MKNSIQEQIDFIRNLKDKNSPECISAIHWLNTMSAESEVDLPQLKHLPSQLGKLLDNYQTKLDTFKEKDFS